MKNFETGEKLKGFTLIELIVVIGMVVIVAKLTYPPYRSTLRSFSLSTTKTNLQQTARLAMKRMVKELGAGMIVDMKEDDNDWEPSGIDHYVPDEPYFIILYLPDGSDPQGRGDEISLYSALPDDPSTPDDESKQPIDPALVSEGERPVIYIRRYDNATSSWEDPEPLIHQEENLKVTQLCFILGGDNQDRVLITLELAQEGPAPDEWRTYKLVGTAKLGAR